MDFIEQQIVAALKPHLEIAFAFALGAKTSTCPIRAAEIKHGAIDDDGLEVHART